MANNYSGYVFYKRDGINFSKSESELIFENIRRILNTRRGERINNLGFGSDITRYLFLPEMSVEDLAKEVVDSIARCEPRVEVESVSFTYNEESVSINLKVRIKNSKELTEMTVEV